FSFSTIKFIVQIQRFLNFILLLCRGNSTANVSPLGEVANFVTVYFPIKIKFLAERKREFIAKFAILPNGC
ncbi:MAG: hypothetical protein V4698_04715, partial [Bacteroidota bacterium]